MKNVVYSRRYAEFITITCLEWKPLLQQARFKNIITASMAFLSKANRVSLYTFVIMLTAFVGVLPPLLVFFTNKQYDK